ncbi:MAG: hypothetical protein CMO55_02980 [Verrucomicrobiales bacterium]|nr:hypothetical protein [Verrucomicrobiales bacterium]
MSLLSVEDLVLKQQRLRRRWFRYDKEDEILIDHVSFAIDNHGSLGLVGEEKSGKFALTLALLKLHEVASGKINFAEVDVTAIGDRHFRRMRKWIQPVFGDRYGQLTPDFTVNESFLEVLKVWFASTGKDDWYQKIETVMIACGLPEAVRVLYPVELDAVERIQVAIARALLTRPRLLICHGVTQGLDVVQQAEILNLIRRLREDHGLALLIVTDDLAVAHHLGDHIGVLHRGKMLEYGNAEVIVNRPEHEYTRRLVSCSV